MASRHCSGRGGMDHGHEEVRWVAAAEMGGLDLAPADAAFAITLASE